MSGRASISVSYLASSARVALFPSILAMCHFMWRGREEGEGEMTYGDENIGSITFLGDGRIRGVMQWMEKFEFIGKKVAAQQVKPGAMNVPRWKEEWRNINDASYAMASAARWGGGQGWGFRDNDDKGDEIPNSDTDSNITENSGEESDDDEDDDERFSSLP
jgi:hypothetical protein